MHRVVRISPVFVKLSADAASCLTLLNESISSEWYAKDISKKVKTGIKTKGMSGKPIAAEAPYGYMKDPDNKDYWIIDEEAATVVRLIFSLFLEGKNRNQIAVYLKNEEVLTPTFYLKYHDQGTSKSRNLNEENRYNWNKATLTRILTRQEYCGDVVNFKTARHYRDKRNHYVDKNEWQIFESVHEPIIDRNAFENVQRILENAPVRRPNCSIKIISRGKGKSAVAAAAYRSGENLTNEYDGITHDYTRKGGVVYTEIFMIHFCAVILLTYLLCFISNFL